jgi:protein-S-isoprenylcysteine O-methyltransferase Ste14
MVTFRIVSRNCCVVNGIGIPLTARRHFRRDAAPEGKSRHDMRTIHWITGIVLAFELPVPFFWLILHGGVEFWRRHVRAGYLLAGVGAWGGGGWLLYSFRASLFPATSRPLWAIVVGLALIAADAWILTIVEMALGGRRLVGHAELTHSGELATRGLYTIVRHPRYLGMALGVLGACLLVGSPQLWIVAALGLGVALVSIRLEERELRARFGPAYTAYAKRVPALLPIRFPARAD